MSPFADLARRFEALIYFVLVAGAAYYLRAFFRSHQRLGGAVFGLERETIQAQRGTALAMLFLSAFVFAALYVFVHVLSPALEPATDRSRPTPAYAATLAGTPGPVLAPTLPTLSPAQLTQISLGTPLSTLPPTPAAVPGVLSCSNPQATLTTPAFGDSLAGPVEARGSANIADFAFYKLEISGPATDGNWQTLSAGSTPVSEGALGSWDTSLYTPGSYSFRLVVYDAAGAGPPPCVIPITIVAIPR